ncbi:MAG: hypothetical protein JW787_13100 [Sedimentisphaerales bacterium]|nr:hypothetical protein [Sedimentisphaerales bacterium]
MNGFILIMAENAKELRTIKSEIPADSRDRSKIIDVDDLCSLVLWGSNQGDVHYSQHMRHSLLILSGYISNANHLEKFKNSVEACDYLINTLDTDHTIKHISKLADQLYGSFSIAYVNFVERKVYCISDRIASRPIWFKKIRGNYIISSHSNSLSFLSKNIEYDLGSLGAFLLYGGPINSNKSLYNGINQIAPGTISIWDNYTGLKEYSWYQYKHNPENSLSVDEWIIEASTRLKNAALRIKEISSQPIVFLSGGIDSRLTASALCSVGVKPILAILGDNENIEVKIARQVAKALDCRHNVIIRDPHWYLRSLERSVFESGGLFLWVHSHFSEAYFSLQKQYQSDSAFLGDFCEAFSKLLCNVEKNRTRIWSPDEFVEEFDNLHLANYKPTNTELTLNLLNPLIKKEVENHVRKDIIDRYQAICTVSHDPKIIADHFFRWQGAQTCPTFSMFLDLRSSAPERSLMFDKDVHELIEILPSDIRDQANFGTKLVRKFLPAAAKIVNSNSLLPAYYPPKLHAIANKHARPIFGKIKRLFLGNSYKTTASFPMKSLLYLKDPEWNTFIKQTLHNSSLYDENIFDHGAISKCWERFNQGDIAMANDIEKLLQIGLIKQIKNKGTWIPRKNF